MPTPPASLCLLGGVDRRVVLLRGWVPPVGRVASEGSLVLGGLVWIGRPDPGRKGRRCNALLESESGVARVCPRGWGGCLITHVIV